MRNPNRGFQYVVNSMGSGYSRKVKAEGAYGESLV